MPQEQEAFSQDVSDPMQCPAERNKARIADLETELETLLRMTLPINLTTIYLPDTDEARSCLMRLRKLVNK